MPLLSTLLSGSTRLNAAASGGPSVKSGLPADDPDAIKRIQRALVALGHPLPISFPDGPDQDPDGVFGQETLNAVFAFQRKVFPTGPAEWDGRVGRNTLAEMDNRLPKGSPPPPRPNPPGLPPALFSTQEAEKAITAYLTREMQRSVVSLMVDHPANLILFGESHFTDEYKAYYLSELVRVVRQRRPVITHFHASERWPNTPETRKIISDLLRAQPSDLSRQLRQIPKALDLVPFAPLLVQAVDFPNRRYGMVPIDMSNIRNEDPRHQALFDSFVNSAMLCPDVPFGSITSNGSRGNMLLGARHSARTSIPGRGAITTCARLIGVGWNVHSVRLTVVAPDPENKESLTVILRRGSADHTPIDLLPILERVAGGRPFYADISKSDSPFFEVRDGDPDAADIGFNKLYDAILHISAHTVPFPTQ